MKTLLVASVILLSLTICGCKEKPTPGGQLRYSDY